MHTYNPLETVLAVTVGSEQTRCACCRTLGASVFCADCRRRLLCEECGHCAEHCSCERKPRCTTCVD